MFNRYKTRGIFLKSEDRGEADRILTAYTENFGKIKIFAKSIRKEESKLRFGTGFFFLNEIEFIEGKNRKTLTDVRIINSYKSIRRDLTASALAYKACEDIDALVKEGEKDDNIWRLLALFLERINQRGKEDGLSPYYHFLWKLFSFLGYHPETDRCLFCRKKIESPPFYFSAIDGGIIGFCCFQKARDPEKTGKEAIELIRVFSKRGFIFPAVNIGGGAGREVEKISEDYLKHLSSK